MRLSLLEAYGEKEITVGTEAVPLGQAKQLAEQELLVARAEGGKIIYAKKETPASQTQPPGGIDLNPALFTMEVRRDEDGIPLPLPQQPIYDLNFDGFIPVIIDVVPITNLNMMLGGEVNFEKVDQLSRK